MNNVQQTALNFSSDSGRHLLMKPAKRTENIWAEKFKKRQKNINYDICVPFYFFLFQL
jgi:hypothetical protein